MCALQVLVRIDGAIECDKVEASDCEFVFAGAKSSIIVGLWLAVVCV